MSANPITVTDTMLDALRQTKPWVTFLAILGFVFTGLITLGAIVMFAAGGMLKNLPHQPGTPNIFGSGLGAGIGVLYLVMAVFVYLLPCLLLIRYSTAIGRTVAGDGQAAMEEALSKQKSFWKYIGILAIVVLALYVLLIIGVIVAAVVIGIHAAH